MRSAVRDWLVGVGLGTVWVRRRAELSEWADMMLSHSLVMRRVGEGGGVVGGGCGGAGDSGGGVAVGSDGPGGRSVVAGVASRGTGSGGGAVAEALVFLGLLNWRDARVDSSVSMWWTQWRSCGSVGLCVGFWARRGWEVEGCHVSGGSVWWGGVVKVGVLSWAGPSEDRCAGRMVK